MKPVPLFSERLTNYNAHTSRVLFGLLSFSFSHYSTTKTLGSSQCECSSGRFGVKGAYSYALIHCDETGLYLNTLPLMTHFVYHTVIYGLRHG